MIAGYNSLTRVDARQVGSITLGCVITVPGKRDYVVAGTEKKHVCCLPVLSCEILVTFAYDSRERFRVNRYPYLVVGFNWFASVT